MRFPLLVFAAALTVQLMPAFADTTVAIVDVQENANARAIWDRIAKEYEAEHKSVKVDFKYIEGES